MSSIELPGTRLASRPLDFIWIADCSGSMSVEGKIQSLNFAIKNSIPEMQKAADENPTATLRVRCISFADDARWIIRDPTPIKDFKWIDLVADGTTAMGGALSMVSQELTMDRMGQRALKPVLVLITDGQASDNFDKGLADLLSQKWGEKAVKIGIAIGDDADLDTLTRFTGNPENVLKAKDAPTLVNMIKWVTTEVIASTVRSDPNSLKVDIVKPPDEQSKQLVDDLF